MGWLASIANPALPARAYLTFPRLTEPCTHSVDGTLHSSVRSQSPNHLEPVIDPSAPNPVQRRLRKTASTRRRAKRSRRPSRTRTRTCRPLRRTSRPDTLRERPTGRGRAVRPDRRRLRSRASYETPPTVHMK